ELAGVRIFGDVRRGDRRYAEIAQRAGAGVDALMRCFLPAGGSAENVTRLERKTGRPVSIGPLTFEHDEQLVLDVVVMERTTGLAGRHFIVANAQSLQAEKGSEGRVAALVERALLERLERQLAERNDGTRYDLGHP